jgi:hypothetical protein
MNKQVLLIIIMSIFSFGLNAQCVRNISTNPDNPINIEFLTFYNPPGSFTINPYLNTFDWQDPTANINIDLDAIWATGYRFRKFELIFIGKYPIMS